MTRDPRTSEPAFNSLLGEVLRRKHPLWKDHLGVEQTRVFTDHPAFKPDLIIHPPKAQPVVVETEYAPALTVEKDAWNRLGQVTKFDAEPVEQAIAVRIPDALRQGQQDLPDRIAQAEFDYCILSGDPSAPDRWPTSGWMTGQIDDIVRCIEQAMVSQRRVNESLAVLEHGVRIATKIIADHHAIGCTGIREKMGRVLNQKSGEQTDRMAMTILVNALAFHSTISGHHSIPALHELPTFKDKVLLSGLLVAWRRILDEVNYWPIFKVAADLLAPIPLFASRRILPVLIRAVERLGELGVTSRHDLAGQMFQRLIVDRKFLATFYTLPTSATLLAEVALRRLAFPWQKPDRYAELRIADLSCGTGTLLSAAYHGVLSRYRHAGGDDRTIHPAMMEESIVAADIMPAAAHLCASQLSSVHPDVRFENTRVYTMPYGVEQNPGQGAALGSLDLIAGEQSLCVFSTGPKQARADGEKAIPDLRLPHGSVDLVIMNPPFTRPTNHEGAAVPVPSFAGFQTSAEEQRIMSARLATLRRGLDAPAGHGNAGLASNFVDLAHMKTKPGGTLALVLPIAVIQGASWQAVRDLLCRQYRDLVVITLATSGSTDRAFSADTGMAEAMVLATKGPPEPTEDSQALFVNLWRRPVTLLEAAEVARLASHLPVTNHTGSLQAGDQHLGSYIRAPLSAGGCAALRESALADVMLRLSTGVLQLPRYRHRHSLSMVSLGALGNRGLLDRDIGTRKVSDPPYRGPFRIVSLRDAPNYPMLWGHEAGRERSFLVPPDSQGDVLPGCESQAVRVWETATRLHFNRDFRLNSQSLAACCTSEPTIGGTAWPNFRLQEKVWEPILTLWANSTLGLMSFWWSGSRQQQGRVRLTISTLPGLLVIDPRSLSPTQWTRSDEIFQEFLSRKFLPANEAYRDSARMDLDRTFLVDILGLPEEILPPLDNLRWQWCHEPSVHGGKGTRPDDNG